MYCENHKIHCLQWFWSLAKNKTFLWRWTTRFTIVLLLQQCKIHCAHCKIWRLQTAKTTLYMETQPSDGLKHLVSPICTATHTSALLSSPSNILFPPYFCYLLLPPSSYNLFLPCISSLLSTLLPPPQALRPLPPSSDTGCWNPKFLYSLLFFSLLVSSCLVSSRLFSSLIFSYYSSHLLI